MNLSANLDLLSVGLATAAIAILAFAVLFNNRNSVTNQAFLFFAVITILWGWVNYSNYQVHEPYLAFWLTKLTLFFAVWHAYGIFQFFYAFPNEKVKFSRLYKFFVFPIAGITSIVVLTPFTLVEVKRWSQDDRIAEIINGPGMLLFALVIFGLIIGAIVLLIKKLLSAKAEKKAQFIYIFVGTILTFALLIVFNFILPAIFAIPKFIPYGMVFIFPFILFTSYAIIRHGFLNLKIISTEFLVFGLSIAVMFEVLVADNLITTLYKSSLFLLVLSIGILLIRSVRNEIHQREKVTNMAKSLETANLRLQELDRQKTEFLSIASHQLRTPMSIIKGYIELIQDGAYGKISQETFKILSDMDETNERLVKLIDEFLDISRIEQGRTKFVFAMHDMKELITSVVKEMAQRSIDKGLKIQWKPGKGKAEICMDDEKVRHVIFNFIDNAIKYSEKGIIRVTLEKLSDGLNVRVKDDGIGFGKVDEANFFQKFYRGSNVKTTNVGGTGLGIYVTKKFIEKHDGKVWAKSKGLGKGGEFGFYLPLNKEKMNTETTDEKKVLAERG